MTRAAVSGKEAAGKEAAGGREVYRVDWVPGTDLLHGVCHCGAGHTAQDPVAMWEWMLGHPEGHREGHLAGTSGTSGAAPDEDSGAAPDTAPDGDSDAAPDTDAAPDGDTAPDGDSDG